MLNDLVQSAAREIEMRKGRRLEYFTLGWNLTEALLVRGSQSIYCQSL